MGLLVSRYTTRSGIELTNVYLEVDSFNYIVRSGELNFSMSLFLNKEKADLGFDPIEQGAILGEFTLELQEEGNDMVTIIDQTVLQKIQEVEGKTDQQIYEHNYSIPEVEITDRWLQFWDGDLRRFIGTDIYSEPEE